MHVINNENQFGKDIPETVYKAIKALNDIKFGFLTIHGQGGKLMISKAKQAAIEIKSQPKIMMVTILTSLADIDLKAIGSNTSVIEQVEKLEPRETLVLPPLGMDVFAYPHREGARKTMEIILAWMDGEKDPGVRMVLIVTHEDNFLNNMKTVYREGEDQLPGIERTRDFRKGKFE
jgi:hypothetical protein